MTDWREVALVLLVVMGIGLVNGGLFSLIAPGHPYSLDTFHAVIFSGLGATYLWAAFDAWPLEDDEE